MYTEGPSALGFSGRRIFACVAASAVAAIFGVPVECHAQEIGDYHRFTLDVGAGSAPIGGYRHSLEKWKNLHFQGGGGIALTPRPVQRYSRAQPIAPRHWNLYLGANFMFERSAIDSTAVQQAIVMNPQNTALLSATGGKAKFYSTTLDLTLRSPLAGPLRWYVLGGFGWFRRTLEFTGASSEGTLLRPTSPGVFGQGGNSGGVDGGIGVDFGRPSRHWGKVSLEGRFLHGLAINSGTWLVPISIGWRW